MRFGDCERAERSSREAWQKPLLLRIASKLDDRLGGRAVRAEDDACRGAGWGNDPNDLKIATIDDGRPAKLLGDKDVTEAGSAQVFDVLSGEFLAFVKMLFKTLALALFS